MIPFCTHQIELELDDHTINLNNATAVYVTIRQGNVLMTFTGDALTLNGYHVTAYLSQQDSAKLRDGQEAFVQVNWLIGDSRAATDPATFTVGEQLLRKVL